MRIITRNKKFFFTGEFKESSPPERVQLGYLELQAIAWR